MRFVRTAESVFGLPLGYKRVEYLESSGTQYIDTGVLANGEFDAKYKIFLPNGYTTNCIIAGARSSTQHLNFGQFETNGRFTLAYLDNYWIGSTGIITSNQYYDIEVSYKSGSQTCKLNGTSVTGASYTGAEALNMNIYIFKRNFYTSGDPTALFTGRLYYFKLWNNGTLVRDFIPCLDPLGVPCMFDLVSKKPYYNAGTGDFSVGRQIIPVEYLESSGTQDVNTDYVPTENTRTIAKLYTEVTNNKNWFGGSSTDGSYVFNAFSTTQVEARFGNGNWTLYNASGVVGSIFTVDFGKNGIFINGTRIGSQQYTTFGTGNMSLRLFVRAGGSARISGRFYYCQIYENDSLVRDYIPAKDENGVGFMFDKVSGTCYLNAGTGAFTYGNEVYTSKLRLIKDAKELPVGYKRVEYIRSDGIDLMYLNPNLNYFPDFEVGVKCDANTDKNCTLGIDGDNMFERFSANLPYWTLHASGTVFRSSVEVSTYADAKYKDGVFSINGNVIGNKANTFPSGNLFLFKAPSANNVYKMNMYFFKAWDNNGALVRNFIPCLDPNNTPCMFDLVEGKPYYNAGTGSFTYGHTITPLEYLESTGTQYINTDIVGTQNTSIELSITPTQINTKIFGCRSGTSSNNISVFYGSSADPRLGIDFNNSNYATYRCQYDTLNQKVIIKADKNNRKIISTSGSVLAENNTVCTDTILTPDTLKLFDITNGFQNDLFIGTCDYCKIWNNNTLVRDFIPVRDENNVGYMFDKVSGTLFGNAGTGAFNVGADVKKKVRFIQDVIPSDYLPLNYLASPGGANPPYIYLGIYPTDTYGYKITNTYKINGGEQCAIGCMDNGNRFVGIYTGGSQVSGGWGSYVGYILNPYVFTDDTLWEVTCNYKNDRKLRLNGIDRADFTNTHISGTISRDVCLFGRKYTGVTPMTGKIYHAEITNGSNVIMDLYPVLRKSDNKPGMYDRITKQFFTKASESATEFNYG